MATHPWQYGSPTNKPPRVYTYLLQIWRSLLRWTTWKKHVLTLKTGAGIRNIKKKLLSLKTNITMENPP